MKYLIFLLFVLVFIFFLVCFCPYPKGQSKSKMKVSRASNLLSLIHNMNPGTAFPSQSKTQIFCNKPLAKVSPYKYLQTQTEKVPKKKHTESLQRITVSRNHSSTINKAKTHNHHHLILTSPNQTYEPRVEPTQPIHQGPTCLLHPFSPIPFYSFSAPLITGCTPPFVSFYSIFLPSCIFFPCIFLSFLPWNLLV